ncbi:MAG: glycosyl hydrolase [Promethearchaeota archaeon]
MAEEDSLDNSNYNKTNFFYKLLHPDKVMRPLIRWWWPGLAVEEKELRHEIEILEKLGFGGFEIQPFLIGGGSNQPREKTHRMAPHPFFYKALKFVLAEAKTKNMKVELTFGSSWPPGGDYITPEKSLKTLLIGTKRIKSNEIFHELNQIENQKKLLRNYNKENNALAGKSLESINFFIELPKINLNAYYKYNRLVSQLIGNVQDDFSKYLPYFKPVAAILIPIKKSFNWGRIKKPNFILPKEKRYGPDLIIDISNLISYDKSSGKYVIASHGDLLNMFLVGTNKISFWSPIDDMETTSKVNILGDTLKNIKEFQLFVFYGGPTGMMPLSCARSDENRQTHKKTSLVVDILNKDAVYFMLENFFGVKTGYFDEIKDFLGANRTLRAIFTDSQEIADEWFWTSDFFEIFRKLRGYDVRPFLPFIFMPNHDNQFLEVLFQNEKPCYELILSKMALKTLKTNKPNKSSIKYNLSKIAEEEEIKKLVLGNRIRFDWYRTLTEVWSSNYIRVLSNWKAPKGLNMTNNNNKQILHRIQVYGMPIEILKAFGSADIPETETLFSGSTDFFKMASSAGLIYGRKIISSETFSWMKMNLTMTPLKWKAACDRLFVSGINQHVFHGWSYLPPSVSEKIKENQSPFFNYPWERHGFSENININSEMAPYYRELNDYVSRAQFIMRHGIIVTNVGIYVSFLNYSYKHLSGEDLDFGTLYDYDVPPLKGLFSGFMRKARSDLDKKVLLQQRIGQNLIKNGFYYMHLNEDAIINARIQKFEKDGEHKAYLVIENQLFDPYSNFPKSRDKGYKYSIYLHTIIIPDCESLPFKVAEKLKRAADYGVNIVFINKIPLYQSEFLNFHENDRVFRSHIKDILLSCPYFDFLKPNIIKKELNALFKKTPKFFRELIGKINKIQKDRQDHKGPKNPNNKKNGKEINIGGYLRDHLSLMPNVDIKIIDIETFKDNNLIGNNKRPISDKGQENIQDLDNIIPSIYFIRRRVYPDNALDFTSLLNNNKECLNSQALRNIEFILFRFSRSYELGAEITIYDEDYSRDADKLNESYFKIPIEIDLWSKKVSLIPWEFNQSNKSIKIFLEFPSYATRFIMLINLDLQKIFSKLNSDNVPNKEAIVEVYTSLDVIQNLYSLNKIDNINLDDIHIDKILDSTNDTIFNSNLCNLSRNILEKLVRLKSSTIFKNTNILNKIIRLRDLAKNIYLATNGNCYGYKRDGKKNKKEYEYRSSFYDVSNFCEFDLQLLDTQNDNSRYRIKNIGKDNNISNSTNELIEANRRLREFLHKNKKMNDKTPAHNIKLANISFLGDWRKDFNKILKYHSGPALYSLKISIPPQLYKKIFADLEKLHTKLKQINSDVEADLKSLGIIENDDLIKVSYILDLGRVYGIAKCQIVYNNKLFDFEDKLIPPYRIDISSLMEQILSDFELNLKRLDSGLNLTIEIKLITPIINYLIGLARNKEYNYLRHYKSRDLAPIGIIGPIKIVPIIKINNRFWFSRYFQERP